MNVPQYGFFARAHWMPRAKGPLCNRQFLVALIPHRGAGGWICCINNSFAFQRKPEEGCGISSIEFHDRSVLMWAQPGGIYSSQWSTTGHPMEQLHQGLLTRKKNVWNKTMQYLWMCWAGFDPFIRHVSGLVPELGARFLDYSLHFNPRQSTQSHANCNCKFIYQCCLVTDTSFTPTLAGVCVFTWVSCFHHCRLQPELL